MQMENFLGSSVTAAEHFSKIVFPSFFISHCPTGVNNLSAVAKMLLICQDLDLDQIATMGVQQ